MITLCFAVYLFAGDGIPVWERCEVVGPVRAACVADICRRNVSMCEVIVDARRQVLAFTLTGRQ